MSAAQQAIRDAADAWAREHGCRGISFCCQTPLAAFDAGVKAERERIRQLAVQVDAFYDAPCPSGLTDCIHQDTPFANLLTTPKED